MANHSLPPTSCIATHTSQLPDDLLRTQHDLFLALSQVRDISDILQLSLDAAIRAAGMGCGGIYLTDEHGGLRLEHAIGLSSDFVQSARHYPVDAANTCLVMRGEPVYTRHDEVDLPLTEAERAEGLRALALIPLRHDQRIIGCLNVASSELDDIPPHCRISLETIASVVGLLISRARSDQALRESEERFQATFEHAAVGIAQVAPDGRWLRINRKLCEIVGYSHDELLLQSFQDITHPDDLETDLDYVHRLLAREFASYTMEKRYIHKQGNSIWVNLTVSIQRKPNGDPDYFIAVVEDIQARKKAEEELRKFSRVIEQTASTVIITNIEGVIEYVNPRFFVTTGYTADEVIGRRPNLLKSGHTSQEEYRSLWQTIKGGNVWHGEFHNRRKDGQLYWESATISPIRDEHGAITHFAGIKDDITDRKRSQEALKESESLLRRAQSLARIGNWRWDFRTDTPFWSRELFRIFGRYPGLPPANYNEIKRYFTTESWDRLSSAVQKTIRVGTPYEVDVEIVQPDGSNRWLLAIGEAIRDSSGTIVELRGMMQDITDRKRAELVRAEQEARYRAVIETASDGFWMLDKDGCILSVNEAYVRLSGYSREELLTMWIGDLEAEESPEEIRAHIEKVKRLGSDLFETRHRAKDGTVWPVEVNTSYSTTAGGIFFAFSRDISERKAMEQQLIEVSTAEQERIGHDIHDGIGQQLTGVAMLAAGIEHRLKAAGHLLAAESIAGLRIHLLDALEEVRALARGLSPVELDPEGLPEALSDLAERIAQTSGLECHYLGLRKVQAEDDILAVHLYRIAQEAVHNAVRHAMPGKIEIRLSQTSEGIVLTVLDDGKGIDLSQDSSKRLGLRLMRYRAGLIGGRLTLGPADGGGTRVSVEVPLKR